MALEDTRLVADGGAYSQADPNARFSSPTANALTITGLTRNENAYRYKAITATSNCLAQGKFNVSASTGASAKSVHISFSDTVGTVQDTITAVGNQVSLHITRAADNSAVGVYTDKVESGIRTNTSTGTLSGSTDYYYEVGRLSSLGGQFGSLVERIFSGSLFGTSVVNSITSLTSAATYDVFNAAQSFNNGTTDSITLTNNAITLFQPAAGIDLTTGVETDTGTGRLVVWPDVIVVTDLNIANGETAKHVAIDKGAGYFADYKVSGLLNVTAFTNGASATMFSVLNVTDAAADSLAANDLQGIDIFWLSATTFQVRIHQAVGGVDTYSAATGALNLQPYSVTLARSGSTLTLKVWNDLVLDASQEGTSQVDTTITLTSAATTTYRYIMPVASALNGATSRSSTFTLGGVNALGNQITATKGAFSWAGKTSPLSSQTISATAGAFSWGGKSSPLSSMIQATKGAFSWAGKTVNLNTGGQVNTTPGAFSWGGKSSPISTSIVITKGAFSWAGKTALIGATVTSLRTAELTYWDTTTSKEVPDTGLTNVLYMLYNPTTGLVFDHSDNTFKASSACVTPRATMTERSLLDSGGTNLTPGIYDILLPTTGLSGLYQEYLFYYGTTNHLDINPVRFQDGVEYLGGLTIAENLQLVTTTPAAIAAVPTAIGSRIVEGAYTEDQIMRIIAAALAGKRAGIGSATETYRGLDGSTTRISLTPDSNGNGTPTLNGA